MDKNLPISSRTTDELLNIIEAGEDWQQDVVESAQRELRNRGFSDNVQSLRRKNQTELQKTIAAIK